MSAVDSPTVANAFVDVADHLMTQMKLHKLTYIAHGWHLAIFGEPLVADAAEAWDNGPVFPLMWAWALEFGCDEQGRILGRGGGLRACACRGPSKISCGGSGKDTRAFPREPSRT